MVKDEHYTLFYGGPFSQWAPAVFWIDGAQYNCAEQYMMAMKAKLFDDHDSHYQIMRASNPATQKWLGRQVVNFSKDVWERVARDVVYAGNLAKFSSIDYYKCALFDTVGTRLVEASISDKIWGIGLSEHNPDARDESKWRGTNWLGEILTNLRDDLMRR